MSAATPVHHPLFARLYAALSTGMEQHGIAALRDELLAGLAGRVVEVGCGNGLNFARYPAEVHEVVGVEPEPYLRARAREAARHAPVRVTVVAGVAEHVPAGEAAFDAAVTSLMLCSVDDQATVLRDLARVVRPGGQLRFFEHVRAASGRLERVQQVLDATLWPRLAGGCHTHRETLTAIRRSRFEVTAVRRLRFPQGRLPLPTRAHVLGRAVLPAAGADGQGC